MRLRIKKRFAIAKRFAFCLSRILKSSEKQLTFAEGDAAFGEVVGREGDFDFVAGDDTDKVFTHPSRHVSGDNVSPFELHVETGVGQGLGDDPVHLECFFFFSHNRVSKVYWAVP